MTNKNFTRNNVSSISRKNGQYFVRYEWTETFNKTFALPVATGNLSMTGKVNISKSVRSRGESIRTRTMVETVEVSEGEAETLFDSLNTQVSRFECGWTAHVVK